MHTQEPSATPADSNANYLRRLLSEIMRQLAQEDTPAGAEAREAITRGRIEIPLQPEADE